MREIKFRVWNVISKKMLGWGAIFDLPAWEIFPGTPEQRPYNVMQYTGLKDRNGKEIYEGDILSISDRKCYNQVVYFDKDGFYCTDEFALSELIRSRHRSFEVVGNIYENPELLEMAK